MVGAIMREGGGIASWIKYRRRVAKQQQRQQDPCADLAGARRLAAHTRRTEGGLWCIEGGLWHSGGQLWRTGSRFWHTGSRLW